MPQNFPEFRTDRLISMRDLHRIWENADTATRSESHGGHSSRGATGTSIGVPVDRPYFIIIGDPSPAVGSNEPPAFYYSWIQVQGVPIDFDTITPSDDPPIGEPPAAVESTYGARPAIEINGRTDVPTGTMVHAWPSDAGDALFFEYASTEGLAGSIDVTDGTNTATAITTISLTASDGLGVTESPAGTAIVTIADAGASQAGIVSTGAQTLAGEKTFADGIVRPTSASTAVRALDGSSNQRSHLELGESLAALQVQDFATRILARAELEVGPSDDEVYFNLSAPNDDEANIAYTIRQSGTTYLGANGSDALGNVFKGGLCTTVGGGGGSGTVTNTGTLTDHAVVVGNGGTDVSTISVGTNGQLLIGQTGADPAFTTMSGDATINASGALTVANNAITDAKLRDSAALSVIGRSANSSGDPADIAAGSDHQVLRRSGTSLGFGAVNLASSNAVTGDLPFANLAQIGAYSVLGVAGNATADVAEIPAAGQICVLQRPASGNLIFDRIDPRFSNAVGAKLYITSGTYTVAHNTITAIPFTAESIDTTALHSTSSNTTRITIPSGYTGIWMFGGAVYAGDPTGFAVSLYIYKNSIATGTAIASKSVAAGVVDFVVTIDNAAAAGDYYELCVYQATGVSKNLSTGGILYPVFWGVYLGY